MFVSARNTIWISLLVLVLLTALFECNYVPKPSVGIEMDSKGFHRHLQYTIQFEYPIAGKSCDYILLQQLPAAVYVSVDQLDDLRRLQKLNAIYPKFVDVELPTEKAIGFSILLRGSPKITDTITLPIHFRYHDPSSERTTATVVIAMPSMYMACPNDEDVHKLIKSNTTYCVNEEMCNFSIDDGENSNCGWRELNVDFYEKTPLRAEIPIGNSKAYPAILYVTIVASWLVSLWTVHRTMNVPRRINHKLEEQRILERKAQ